MVEWAERVPDVEASSVATQDMEALSAAAVKVHWALLTLKRRLKRGGVSMAYKIYKTRIS
jgi:hypothetical protein